ncbi:MAG: hypothetical protein KDA80_24480, partial [Planctomycetaceae bacterium]|nr:hypothetical protein [Planctomycetaceae bacterium]
SFVQRHGITFPMIKDAGNKIADQLGAERTPEIFVLDHQRAIRYRGRVDDQYVVGIVREKPTRSDLEIAVEELLTGKSVSVPETQALGCIIGRVRPVQKNSPVTYSKEIARIFETHCVECHRDGEIAPFTLTSYGDTVGWGEMILEVTEQRRMPPWHASPEHGEFLNARRLSEEEIAAVRTWVEHGCPQGNPNDLPQSRQFTSGWQLSRKPDQVFPMRDKPFTVPADAGPDGVAYQNFWIDPQFTEDKWIREMEAIPGNRAVVHHIIVYAHPDGKGSRGDSFIAAYVPGLRLDSFPPGAAKKIPAGSWLRFQVHYTPIGSEQQDLSQVGFIYADPQAITHEVRTTEAVNTKFQIQPYKKDQKFSAQWNKSPVDMELLSMSPHMHFRGQAFRYTAHFPDRPPEVLLDIPAYDFNWQTRYVLTEPVKIPQGTKILCEAMFDNSASNLANPDPSKLVTWGDQSWDEMLIGYMDVMFPVSIVDEKAPLTIEEIKKMEFLQLIERLKKADKDANQRLDRGEVTSLPVLKENFDKIDVDASGQLTVEELRTAWKKLKNQRE